MKSTIKFLSLLFSILILTNIANADSPREQLKQMVGRLQQSPNDNALREKIIKLAQQLKPAPAVPEEAERHMAYGTAAFTGAKSLADYKEAAKEFEQATLAAPWYGDAYFNLGVAQDKAENYEAALRSLKLARLASPDSKDIKALIYQVEYRNKKAQELRLVFGEESWTEIRDKDGNILSSQVNQRGSELRLEGSAPFSMMIGHAASVSLYYRGKQVDLKPYINKYSEVAHLELK